MTYLPFARKWRPQNFDEVVGQKHITTILKNAISLNRVHHAYLFAGPRGIGKTSTARILSKALDCEKGPLPIPCNKCVPCMEITGGSSLDVIEIDGASNRGIDEIRNLRETVKFLPSKGRYKIYIIDEVHMLTTEAFNALLKTLEEPPNHVKFIFATTEPHKIPATILSRCQRFDFKRIPMKDIVAMLKKIAEKENLEIEEDVFLYVAKSSDGSMRDAESILDQVASFSGGKINIKDVVDSLGMIEQGVLFECGDIIINKDTKAGIHLVGDVLNSGKDAKQFLSDMLEHFRNIMIAKTGVNTDDLIDLPKEAVTRVKKQAESLSLGDVFYIMGTISNSLRMIKQLLPARIVLELCVIKLTSRDSIASIQEILSKLHDIDKDSSFVHPAASVPQASSAKPVEAVQGGIVKKIHDAVNHIRKENPAPKEKVFSGAVKNTVDISRVKTAWPILIKAMAVKKISVSTYLSEGEPESVNGNVITVSFPKELSLHREVLDEKHNRDFAEKELSQILDTAVKLHLTASDRAIKPRPQEDKAISTDKLKKQEPIINNVLDMFGGRILWPAKNT